MTEILKCKNCNLCNNQLPLLDKKTNADIMWVGLSAKKVANIDINITLENDTNSGKLIEEVENHFTNLIFYKTNLVKCLPLDDKNKLRYPTKSEMEICIKNLFLEFEMIKPKLIILLGNNTSDFIMNYIERNNIVLNIPMKKIEHPSYISVYKRKYKQDYIDKVIRLIKLYYE